MRWPRARARGVVDSCTFAAGVCSVGIPKNGEERRGAPRVRRRSTETMKQALVVVEKHEACVREDDDWSNRRRDHDRGSRGLNIPEMVPGWLAGEERS